MPCFDSMSRREIGAWVAGILLLVCFFSSDVGRDTWGRDPKAVRRHRQGDRLRYLRNAVESYAIDWHTYPAPVPIPSDAAAIVVNAGLRDSPTTLPVGLTTPLAYMDMLPLDPYFVDSKVPFYYHRTVKTYILWSAGPDQKFDLRRPGSVYEQADKDNLRKVFAPYTYNPTNGVESAGDLWVCAEHNWPW